MNGELAPICPPFFRAVHLARLFASVHVDWSTVYGAVDLQFSCVRDFTGSRFGNVILPSV